VMRQLILGPEPRGSSLDFSSLPRVRKTAVREAIWDFHGVSSRWPESAS